MIWLVAVCAIVLAATVCGLIVAVVSLPRKMTEGIGDMLDRQTAELRTIIANRAGSPQVVTTKKVRDTDNMHHYTTYPVHKYKAIGD